MQSRKHVSQKHTLENAKMGEICARKQTSGGKIRWEIKNSMKNMTGKSINAMWKKIGQRSTRTSQSTLDRPPHATLFLQDTVGKIRQKCKCWKSTYNQSSLLEGEPYPLSGVSRVQR